MQGEKLKFFLEEKLGLTLTDDGEFWRTSAVFRDGKNPMSVRVSKTTGFFSDFGSDTKGGLKKLAKLISGKDDISNIEEFLKETEKEIKQKKKEKSRKAVQEKIFGKEVLDLMFPNYSFYKKRGISEETLRRLNSGLFQEWKMYLRFCFPIYNEFGEVIGFSGRDVTDSKPAKWKKLGKSYNWIYPLFVPVNGDLFFLNQVEEKREVIIVESIGDMLALHEAGIFNVVVTFGTTFSDALFSFLSGLTIDRFVIATNNDFTKGKENTGELFGLKIFLKLCLMIPFWKITFNLPPKKDFGEMSVDEILDWYDQTKNIDKKANWCRVLKMARSFYPKNKNLFSPKVIKELKRMQESL